MTEAGRERSGLALLGGLVKPPPSLARGTSQAAFSSSYALIARGRFAPVDVYHEAPERIARGVEGAFMPPPGSPVRLCTRGRLPYTAQSYAAVHATEGELQACVPHVLRPWKDWVPVVCEIGTTHSKAQWCNLFVARTTGALRATDGFIFKSQPLRAIFQQQCEQWDEAGYGPGVFPRSVVIPNGVDPSDNRRDEEGRRAGRAELAISDSDVVFLVFTRLSPGTKGDLRSLVALWRQVTVRCPNAMLLLAGATVDRAFEAGLMAAARQAGIGNRVLLASNPFELWPRAKTRLMSSADVFVHLTTGIEEASPQVILQAMAHGLPVVASDWAGIREVVVPEEHGYLVRTLAAPCPLALGGTFWGRSPEAGNVEMSRSAACDPREVIAAAMVLADSCEKRRQLGEQARRSVENHHTLERAAQRKIAFLTELSSAARQAHPDEGGSPPRSFVDIDRVLASQANDCLSPDQRLRIGDKEACRLVPDFQDPTARSLLGAVVEMVATEGSVTVGDLFSSMTAVEPAADPTRSETERGLASILLRLFSYGVIEVAR